MKCPQVYIVKTFFPFPQFYFSYLHRLVEEIRGIQIEKYIEQRELYDKFEALEEIDSALTNEIIETHIMKQVAVNFMSAVVPSNAICDLEITVFDKEIVYELPELDQVSYLPTLYSAKACIANLAFEDFLFIYFSIFHERTVVFVSESRAHISSTM